MHALTLSRVTQADSFDSERQSWYDQEQHYKTRIAGLASSSKKSRRKSPPSSGRKATSGSEVEGDEADQSENDGPPRTPRDRLDLPARSSSASPSPSTTSARSLDLSTPATSEGPSTPGGATSTELALRAQLDTLSTAHTSLSHTLRALQTEMADLKRVYQDLQEENESYEILLGERTLSGEVSRTELFRKSFQWGESGIDGEEGVAAYSGAFGFAGGLEAVGEEAEDAELGLSSDDEEDDEDATDATGKDSDEVEKVLLESKGTGEADSVAVATDSGRKRRKSRRSMQGSVSGAGGLDLAAELEAAQKVDEMDEVDLARQKQREERRKKRAEEKEQKRKAAQEARRASLGGGTNQGKSAESPPTIVSFAYERLGDRTARRDPPPARGEQSARVVRLEDRRPRLLARRLRKGSRRRLPQHAQGRWRIARPSASRAKTSSCLGRLLSLTRCNAFTCRDSQGRAVYANVGFFLHHRPVRHTFFSQRHFALHSVGTAKVGRVWLGLRLERLQQLLPLDFGHALALRRRTHEASRPRRERSQARGRRRVRRRGRPQGARAHPAGDGPAWVRPATPVSPQSTAYDTLAERSLAWRRWLAECGAREGARGIGAQRAEGRAEQRVHRAAAEADEPPRAAEEQLAREYRRRKRSWLGDPGRLGDWSGRRGRSIWVQQRSANAESGEPGGGGAGLSQGAQASLEDIF